MARKKTVDPVIPPSLTFNWTLNRESLLSALKLAGTVAKNSGKLPYLDHVILKSSGSGVTLAATNLDETITATVEAEVLGDGAFCLPFKIFDRIASADPSDTLKLLRVEGQPFSAAIQGDGTYSVMGLDPADYPNLPQRDDVKDWGELPLAELSDALDRSRRFIGVGKLDLGACLVSMEGDSLVVYATDSYRLWREELAELGATMPGGDASLSIGVGAFDSLCAMEGDAVSVGWSDQRQHLVFLSEDGLTMVAFRRPEAKHFNYESIMNRMLSEEFRATVDAAAMASAVKRAQPTSRADRVQFVREAGRIEVLSESAEGSSRSSVADLESSADADAAESTWKFQLLGDFVLDGLAAMDCKSVRFLVGGGSASSPMSLTMIPAGKERPLRTVVTMGQEWGK